jgi:hypothetical protein
MVTVIFLFSSQKLPDFTEMFSQKPVTGPYLSRMNATHINTCLFKTHVNMIFHICLDIPVGLLFSVF